MKKGLLLTVVSTLLLGPSGAFAYALLFTAHSNGGQVGIIDKNGKIVWSMKANHPQRADISADGKKIFVSESHGAKMVDMDTKKVLWEYVTPKVKWDGAEAQKVKKGDEVWLENPVAQILGEDRFLVGNEGKSKMMEINSKGEVLKEIVSESLNKVRHGEFRLASKTDEGTYLFPLLESSLLTEYDSDGKQILRVKTDGGVVGAQRLSNGDVLAGGFFGVSVFNRKGETVWNFSAKEMQQKLNSKAQVIICDVKELPNGNIACTTYCSTKDLPDILEITKDKRIVRTLDFPEIFEFSALQVLDDDFKPVK